MAILPPYPRCRTFSLTPWLVLKRLLTNSWTPQNPWLPCEPVVKWLGLKQPLSGAFCSFLQKVGQPLPEIKTRQPVSNNVRPIIWASMFHHSMLLVANWACEVCLVIYHCLQNYSFDCHWLYWKYCEGQNHQRLSWRLTCPAVADEVVTDNVHQQNRMQGLKHGASQSGALTHWLCQYLRAS